MVVLDALHWVQGHEAPDLAVRWNCKAAKCGSCSAEVDGRPRLTCKTRLSDFDLDESDHGRADARVPADPRPRHGRLVELRGQQDDPAVHAARGRAAGGLALAAGGHRARPGVPQVHRVLPVPGRLPRPAQPRDREAVHGSALPRPGGRTGDAPDRPGATGASYLKDSGGIGYCNITKCCTEVCPEHIKITDNAIIPLKERVADEYYDPIQWAWRKLRGADRRAPMSGCELPMLQRADRRRPSQNPTAAARRPIGRPIERHVLPGTRRRSRRGAPAERRRAASSSAPTARRVATRDRRPSARPCTTWHAPMRVTTGPCRTPRSRTTSGVQTNNVAEYTGVVRALALAHGTGRQGGRSCCSIRS